MQFEWTHPDHVPPLPNAAVRDWPVADPLKQDEDVNLQSLVHKSPSHQKRVGVEIARPPHRLTLSLNDDFV